MVELAAAPLRAPEEQLQLLAFHLRLERGGLLIVASPDAEAERALVEEVRLRVGNEVAVEQVTFAPEPIERLSLSHHLSTLPPRSGKAAVFVFGLDDLPPDARTTAINAMNWGRERLRWSGYMVVLWVRPGTPGEIGNRAPDFFSWRSDVFEFDIPLDPVARQQMLARLRLFAPAALPELRQRYCDYVVRTYQWLDFRGLLQLRTVVRLPLDELFVPLQATTTVEYPPLPNVPLDLTPGTVPEWHGYERQRLERRVALNDAVRQHKHFVVLGDPGSGKSTLLRFLALTFAQSQPKVQERLDLDEARLPILVPLSAFAEARNLQPDLLLAAFLPRYFTEQGLPDFSPLFEHALNGGRALVLLDGLDEMLTYNDRVAVARAVVDFASEHPTARIIVTSRIAGYTAGLLPASFATFTLAPFDDEAIKRFARQWSLAFEAIGLPAHAELPPDAHRRALLRADNLTAAATSHPGVRRLATNPLLLTLLALIHHQGTRLPNRRTELYRLCVEALAETWNLARSLSGRPIDLRLGERRLDEEFVVHMLAPVAYWMHENKPTGLISRDELEAQVAEQFNADGSPEDTALLARDFVNLAREQMGLFVERTPDEFSFLHLSIQEYLAARFVSERKDGFERLKPRLHYPRWREVVLLTAVCLRGDYAAEFVENILNAHSPFDDLPQRVRALAQSEQEVIDVQETLLSAMDLLLAAQCLSVEVPVSSVLHQRIRDALFDLWLRSSFTRLHDEITRVFPYLKESALGSDVRAFLTGVLCTKNMHRGLRTDAAQALAQVGCGIMSVTKTLLDIAQDRNEDTEIRRVVILGALGQAALRDAEAVRVLREIAQDKHENVNIRTDAAVTLRQAGQEVPELLPVLLHLVRDKAGDRQEREEALWAFGRIGLGNIEVITTLLNVAHDKSEAAEIRGAAVWALGETNQGQAGVVTTLLRVLCNRNESLQVRWNASEGLGHVVLEDPEVAKTLRYIVQNDIEDGCVHASAAESLLQVIDMREEAVRTLVIIARDQDQTPEARWLAVSALRYTGQESPLVVKTLLSIVQDKSDEISARWHAARSLGEVGKGKIEVVNILTQATGEPVLRDAALGALWNVLTPAA